MTVATTTHASTPERPSAASTAASLAGKPSSGGTPAIDAPETTATANATGIDLQSPDELADVPGAGADVDLADDHEQCRFERGVGGEDRTPPQRSPFRFRPTAA